MKETRAFKDQISKRLVLFLPAVVAIFFAATVGCDENGAGDGHELIADGDDESGSDADSDMDSDADGDADGDADTGADSDSDGDADWDIETDGTQDTDEEVDTEEECNTENSKILYLSADDSNSMAGAVIARATINQGGIVYWPVRTYEFLNYYNFGYQAAEAGHVNVTAEMRANGEEDNPTYNLQIGVRSPDQSNKERRPLNITLSLDTSGSMSGNPIELVRESCKALAGSFRVGDIISIVTWNSAQTVLLESYKAAGPNDPVIVASCESLISDGTTDLHSGLVKAYELARENFNANRINRVILMSDGGANTGITDEDLIAKEADDADGEAIYLMGVGISDPSNYNDSLMNTITDKGKGAYIFIDSMDEAQKMFGERFLSNVEVAARDVQVELTLPPSFDMVKFDGEQISTNPEEVEPQHLAPNDAMIFHQTVASCDQSAVTMNSPVRVAATFDDPITREEKVDELDTTLGALLEGDNTLLLKGDAVVAYADALKKSDSYNNEEIVAAIDVALKKVEAAKNVLEGDQDLLEIGSLLIKYRALVQNGSSNIGPND